MIQKVLIANRGEIAVRIIRACREMSIQTVAVYASVDKDSLHCLLADEAICIGDHRAYLNQEAILQAAINTQANAIHPGYGFLSENADFVRKCEGLGIKFIGPKSEHIDIMGDKVSARQTMVRAGVPVVPGSQGLIEDYQEAQTLARDIGYPVLIKATAGGGGKGMRVCYEEAHLEEALTQAQQEGKAAFGNSGVYLEKFIVNPRHIEVQVMGDSFGNAVHLFERECSVQRNNQKMIEEAPVQNIAQSTKDRLYEVCIKACETMGYESLGTFEFIMDRDENFYFIEMNTRLQVEHPITELITGVDLVQHQIRIAEGKRIAFKQSDISVRGHAIEIRINAEDPYHNFRPHSGKVNNLHFPGGNGVRVDSFIYPSYTIQPYFDSMIAKLIVFAYNRDEAMEKAIRSLEELDIDGIATNVDFQLELLLSEPFQDNVYDTSLVKQFIEKGGQLRV